MDRKHLVLKVAVLLGLLTVAVSGRLLTKRPVTLHAADIRDNTAELVVQAASDVFDAPSLRSGVQLLSNATNEAVLIVFAEDSEGPLAAGLQAGTIRLNVKLASPQNVAISVTGNYYAYTQTTLFLTVNRHAFTPGNIGNGPYTARFVIPAEPSSMRRPREITTGCLGAISVFLALVGKETHTGLISLGRQSLLARFLECDDELDFILHPTQISVGGSKNFGTLMMNISIVLVLAAFHTGFTRLFPKVFSPHLPADHLLFLVIAYPGTTLATAETVIRTSAPVRWALALVIMSLLYGAVIGSVYLSKDRDVVYSDRFRAWGHKYDSTFVPRWRVLFKPYRGGAARLYLVVELFFTCALAISAASPNTSGTHDGCFYQASVGTFIVIIDLVVLLVVWPYHTGRELGFSALMKTIEVAVAGEAVAATLQANVDSTMVIIGNVMLIIGAVVVLIKYNVSFIIAARGADGAVDAVSGDYIELMEREQSAFPHGPGLHEVNVAGADAYSNRSRSRNTSFDAAGRDEALAAAASQPKRSPPPTPPPRTESPRQPEDPEELQLSDNGTGAHGASAAQAGSPKDRCERAVDIPLVEERSLAAAAAAAAAGANHGMELPSTSSKERRLDLATSDDVLGEAGPLDFDAHSGVMEDDIMAAMQLVSDRHSGNDDVAPVSHVPAMTDSHHIERATENRMAAVDVSEFVSQSPPRAAAEASASLTTSGNRGRNPRRAYVEPPAFFEFDEEDPEAHQGAADAVASVADRPVVTRVAAEPEEEQFPTPPIPQLQGPGNSGVITPPRRRPYPVTSVASPPRVLEVSHPDNVLTVEEIAEDLNDILGVDDGPLIAEMLSPRRLAAKHRGKVREDLPAFVDADDI